MVPGKPLARLELARDVLRLRAALGTAQTVNGKHLTLNRLTAVRRLLLGRPGAELIDTFLAPATAQGALQALADSAMGMDTTDKAVTAAYVAALDDGLTALHNAERRHGADGGVRPMLAIPGGWANHADAIIDTCVDGGRVPDELRAQFPALQKDAELAMAFNADELLKQHAPDVLALREAARAESDRLLAEYRRLQAVANETFKEFRSGSALKEDFDAATDAAHAAYEAYSGHHGKALLDANNSVRDAIAKARASLQAPLVAAATAYTDAIMAASAVSEEEATAWAEAQVVTPQARARLKKIGYDLKQMRRDMAEFYRFTGGRVVKVKVHSRGDRRANATDIEDHGKEGVIHLDSRFDKRVLWHELAHHIEADPVAKMAAGKFIRRRSVDGKAYSLRSLTGNKGYRSNEGAYKDHFFDHYVGKIYRDGATEVFSMAVESFTNPLVLGQRLLKDAETIEFVAGYLKQPMHPLAKAHMALRGRLIDANNNAAEESSVGAKALHAELAAGVEFVADTDISWLDATGGWAWRVREKQVGRFPGTDWYLFEAKVRNPETGRRINGYQLMRAVERPGIYDEKTSWYLEHFDLSERDLTLAKVTVAFWQKTGSFPRASDIKNTDYLKRKLQS